MAVDVFLKLADVKGESKDDKHKDEIEVLSWSWGISNPVDARAGAGKGAGKANFNDLSFMHSVDRSSPVLMLVGSSLATRSGSGPQFPERSV